MKSNEAIRQLRIKLRTHLVIQGKSQDYADGYNSACDFFEKILIEVEKGEKPIPKDIVNAELKLEKH